MEFEIYRRFVALLCHPKFQGEQQKFIAKKLKAKNIERVHCLFINAQRFVRTQNINPVDKRPKRI